MWSVLIFCLVAALGVGAFNPPAQATPHPGQVELAGREYVRVADWARVNDFELQWLKRDDILQLSNQASKLVLTADSREAEFNGIQVLLSFPVVLHHGAACISQLDLQSTITPLISPAKNQPKGRLKSVCLDPGHGGKDPGFQAGSHQEKKYTLLLAQEVRELLAHAGIKATLTRTTDKFIELPERPRLAKRCHADLFVSLHFNSAGSSAGSVRGAETYCLTPPGAPSTNAQGEGGGGGGAYAGNRNNQKNVLLAYQLQKSLVKDLGAEDRGVRRARFAVLRDAVMPAVLIEAGYMSHPAEGPKIFDVAYRRQMARAIVDGVLAYRRAVEQAG